MSDRFGVEVRVDDSAASARASNDLSSRLRVVLLTHECRHRLDMVLDRLSLWNSPLPEAHALRWTIFTLVERPKDRNWVRGLTMALRGLPWVRRERQVIRHEVEVGLRVLDRRRFAQWRERRRTRRR